MSEFQAAKAGQNGQSGHGGQTEESLSELATCLAAAADNDVNAQTGLTAARRAAELSLLLQRTSDQARAEGWACIHQMRLGRHQEVLEQAPSVVERLQDAEEAALRRELLWCITLCGSEVGRFDQALDAAHELVSASQSSADPRQALVAAYALGVCLERMGDSWQAERLLREALQAYGQDEPNRPWLVVANAVCAVAIGIAHRLRDTGADAERQDTLLMARRHGEQALALLQHVPDPLYEVAVPGNLGEILLLLGDTESARPLLDRALQLARARSLHAHAWRVQTSLADWLLATGQPQQARDAISRLLRDMGPSPPQQTAIRAHDTAYRACRALRRYALALQHLEAAERLERSRTTTQLKAQSQLFVTRTEAQRARQQAEQAQADASRQRERAAEFAAEAERDPLTGLGNRRHLERRCAELLPEAECTEQPLALALLDLDHFKQVNDLHGHAVGDRVLVAVAQLLRERTRAGDVLARYGGEEFVIVLPGMGQDRAIEVCDRLRERLAAQPWARQSLPAEGVTVSIGLAMAPPYHLDQLLHAADQALYQAKGQGRNRLTVAGA